MPATPMSPARCVDTCTVATPTITPAVSASSNPGQELPDGPLAGLGNRSERVAEPVEEPAPAPLAVRGAVHAVEEGDLLGQAQPRPAALGDELHRRQRGRRADLPGGQHVGEDDPLAGHDVEEEGVVAPGRAANGAEARPLEAAD